MHVKIDAPLAVVRPDYIIKGYGDVAQKVIRFNKSQSDVGLISEPKFKADSKSYDEKLQESISRARSMVLQKALCNPWDWFITLTLDKSKFGRYDLGVYISSLSQWLRNRGKAYGGHVNYLLVPEMHGDGAWHMHGFISGIPSDRIEPFKRGIHPLKLIRGGYLNWPDYFNKFGFCSLGRIKNPFKAALYLSKYISKGLTERAGDRGAHLYYASRGLKSAENSGYCYGVRHDLDGLLTHHSEFCSTGWAVGVPWWWSFDKADELPGYVQSLSDFDIYDYFNPSELSLDFVNVVIDGF